MGQDTVIKGLRIKNYPTPISKLIGIALVCVAGPAVWSADETNALTFEDYASIEARTDGAPVWCLDYMMYIYGIGPDIMPGVVMQEGNTNPLVKIKPKKSWEIKHNLFGTNTEQVPRSRKNDRQPVLPIHLIDGDPETVWGSYGSIQPDYRPEWIRIDIPVEANVSSVVLVLSKKFAAGSNWGSALPRDLTVKVSTDAWHWETVFESQSVDIEEKDAVEIEFSPRPVKQVWIIGNNFTKRMGSGPAGFSVGEVEVRNTDGHNVALLSRGSGVTVSSTHFTGADNRLNQDALWAPLHYDMGMKWIRNGGAGIGAYRWAMIEQEKGVYELDPVLDQWYTDLHEHGVRLVLGLDLSGNPIYREGADQIPTSYEVRQDERFHAFPDPGGDVRLNPEMLDPWLKYIEYMAGHLKDRVYIWEIGNERIGGEWNDAKLVQYMEVFEKAYETIKRVDPDARVMPNGSNFFAPDLFMATLGMERKSGVQDGKLAAHGGDFDDLEKSTLVVNKKIEIKDGEVSVDALNRGQFGLVLRYQNPDNFILVSFSPYMRHIIERSSSGKEDDATGPEMDLPTIQKGTTWSTEDRTTHVYMPPTTLLPGTEINLKVRLERNQVTLTMSDGLMVESVTHTINNEELLKEGNVGLVQLTGAYQQFDNFQVADLDGELLLNEEFNGENGSFPGGWTCVYGQNPKNPIEPGWASKIDGLSWHPNQPQEGNYYKWLGQMQKDCEALGFDGEYYCSEFFHFFTYPAYSVIPDTELQQAILSMQSAVGHAGRNTVGMTQILHFTGFSHYASNCRWTWPNQIATPVQPSVMYYMWRTLSTVIDDFHPTDFPVDFKADRELLSFTFQRGDNERMVAVWIPNPRSVQPNDLTETLADVTLPGTGVDQAWVIDLMNGTEQKLNMDPSGNDTIIRRLQVKDYPVLIRFITSN